MTGAGLRPVSRARSTMNTTASSPAKSRLRANTAAASPKTRRRAIETMRATKSVISDMKREAENAP
jgi:hypothetical protein